MPKRITFRTVIDWTLVPILIGLSAYATSQLLPRLPLKDGQPPQLQRYPKFIRPGPDSFFAVPEHTELSHSVLFHGLGRSIENARQADVLFLGNSRMPLGLREEFLVPKAEERGLHLFSLATGYAERLTFPLAVIRKHDLRPRVLVVSGGPQIFRSGISVVAQEAFRMSRWDALKQSFEESAAWRFRTRLHSVIPKIDFFGRRLHSDWIIYRSERTGWWQPVASPKGQQKATLAQTSPKTWNGMLPRVRKFNQEMRDRGTLLVLTTVPYAEGHVSHLAFLSKELGIPAIIPSFDGAMMVDDSHLDRESAARVSAEFWDSFIHNPDVKRALGLP